jgi:hypothetical protein
MPLSRTHWHAAHVLSVALVAFSPTIAHAITKAECTDAYSEAQVARRAGRLVSAKQMASTCSASECPTLVRDDCALLFEELRKDVPRVTFSVQTGEGVDIQDAAIEVDGAPLAPAAAGRSLELDPGKHTARFSWGGDEKIQSFVLAEGDAPRVVRAVFGRAATAPKSTPTPPATSTVPARSGGAPVPAIVTTIAGATVLVAGGIAYGVGSSIHSTLSDDLKKRSASGAITGTTQREAEESNASGTTYRVVGLVGMGVGLAATVGGIAWWMSGSSRDTPSVAVTPLPGGSFVSYSRSF